MNANFRRRFVTSDRVPLFLLLGFLFTVSGVQPADGQGLLRRLGNRIRGSVPPPPSYQPPPSLPSRPTGIAPRATDPNDAANGLNSTSPNPLDRSRPNAQRIAPRSGSNTGNIAGSQQPNRERGTLGIEAQAVRLPVPGIQIVRLLPYSKLGDSGIRPGDILIGFDGRPVRTLEDISQLLVQSKPGDQIRVRIVRNMVSYDANVALTANPTARLAEKDAPTLEPVENEDDAVQELAPLRPQISDTPPSTNADLGLSFDASAVSRGIIVSEVQPGSIAAVSGIQVGDRIVSMDGRFLPSADALRRAMAGKPSIDSTKLQIVRNDRLMERSLRPAPAKGSTESTVASSPTGDPAEAPNNNPSGGLGSILGSWFGGGNSKPNETEKPARDDEMAFGDDEPIDTNAFDVPVERPLDP